MQSHSTIKFKTFIEELDHKFQQFNEAQPHYVEKHNDQMNNQAVNYNGTENGISKLYY